MPHTALKRLPPGSHSLQRGQLLSSFSPQLALRAWSSQCNGMRPRGTVTPSGPGPLPLTATTLSAMAPPLSLSLSRVFACTDQLSTGHYRCYCALAVRLLVDPSITLHDKGRVAGVTPTGANTVQIQVALCHPSRSDTAHRRGDDEGRRRERKRKRAKGKEGSSSTIVCGTAFPGNPCGGLIWRD